MSVLAAAAVGVSSRLEAQRLNRAFMVPRNWPAATAAIPMSVAASLTTDLGGAFVHYKLTLTPTAKDAVDVEDRLNAVNFTVRLLDKDGFTILLIRPPVEDLVAERNAEGRPVSFHFEDVVGCSVQVYAKATSWSIDWEGR